MQPRGNVPVISERAGALRIAVHVKPKASRSRVLGERNGSLELSVTAPPVDGAANLAVRELLAEVLGVPLRSVEIVSGESARSKVVEVTGAALPEARRRLGI